MKDTSLFLTQSFDFNSKSIIYNYYDLKTNKQIDNGNEKYCNYLVENFSNKKGEKLVSNKKEWITDFTNEYGFVNKRLPVMAFHLQNEKSSSYYIDPSTGHLAAYIQKSNRLEGLSFAFLHKFHFLDSYGKNFGTYNGILPINEWCHFVCVKTKNEFFYFIDNKKYTMPYNDFNIAKTDLNQVLVFGKKSDYGGIFSGLLDDVAIYNRSLSDQEVESLYKSLPTNEIPSYVPKNGLVAWYPFNGNANDESGNKHHGTVIGATPSIDRFGNENKAYYFDKDSIRSTIKNLMVNNAPVTFTGWFKSNVKTDASGWPLWTTDIPAYAGLFKYGAKNNVLDINIYSKGYFHIYVNDPKMSNPRSIQDQRFHNNSWYHFAITYNGDSIKPFINGRAYNNYVKSGRFNILDSMFTIGKDFLGTLDDISVHNRVLTDTEISSLYKTDSLVCTTPTVSVFVEGKSTMCEGQSTNIVATSNPNYNYQWYKNNNNVTGATTHYLTTKESGVYYVIVKNGTCEFKSDELTISVNTPPTASLIVQGKTAYCDGEKIATNLRVDGGTTFTWNTGETTASIDVTTAGTSSVIVGNNTGCTVILSQQIISSTLPKIAFEGLATYVFKNEPAIKLYTSPAGGTLVGQQIKDNMYYPANDNVGKHTISYSVTSLEGCTNNVSRSFYLVDTLMSNCTKILYDTTHVTTYDTVTVTNKITKYDTITVKTNVYDTVTITNTVTKYDTLTVKNNVYDTITFTKYDTIKIFDTVSILKFNLKLTTGIKENQVTQLAVYPNPTSDVLIIETTDLTALQGYRISLVDLAGKEIQNIPFTAVKTELDVKKTLAKGMYVLHILDANNVRIQTTQIVIE